MLLGNAKRYNLKKLVERELKMTEQEKKIKHEKIKEKLGIYDYEDGVKEEELEKVEELIGDLNG